MAAAEEGFHDYTLATKLERLVAQLEQCFRGWMLTGLENISHLPPAVGPDRQPMGAVRVNNTIEHRMPWRTQPYILTLHVPYTRESDLQAAKQQQQALQLRAQQQAQQQQQQQQAQQQQAAVKPAAAALPAPAAAAGDVQQAVTTVSAALAQHVAPTAAAGGPAAVDKLQAQLAPLMASSDSNGGGGGSSAAAAEGGNGNGSNEQVLQQQVQELIEQYRMVHLQLQADDAQAEEEQQGEELHAADAQQPPVAGGGEASAEALACEAAAAAGKAVERSASSGSLLDVLSGLGRLGSRAAGSSGGRRVSDAASAAGSGRAGSPESPAAPTPAGGKGSSSKTRQLNATKLSRQAASRRASSSGGSPAADASTGTRAAASSTGAADGAAAAAAVVDELDEASSRQVELPAAEELVAAGSSALAAVRAAVQQDQSRTSASRSWWPFCYSLQQQQQHQAGSSTPTPLRPPWWSPGAGSHKLQRWFGLDLFVLLQPASYSRRFLDAAESSSLLSVGRLALSSSGAAWPLLLPVHDALRDAYVGSAQVGALSVSFNTDSIHTSRLPRHLSATERQLQLFAEQLLPHNPAGAAACLAIIGHSSEPCLWARIHTKAGGAAQTQQQQGVWLSACSTYSLPDASRCHWLQHALAGSSNSSSAQAQAQPHALGAPHASDAHQLHHHHHAAPDDDDAAAFEDWDADSAWHPWAQHRDPVQALELDVIWADRQLVAADDAAAAAFAAATTAAQRPAALWQQQQQQHVPLSCEGMGRLLGDASAADVWLLHVLQHGFSSAPTRPGRLGVRSVERHRRHVSVAATGADWLWTAEAAQQVLAYGGRLSGVQPQPWGQAPRPDSFAGLQLDPGSFTTMLSALLTARTAAAAAHSLWELAGADWWEGHGEISVPPLPPDSVLDSVLHDLLSPPRPAAMGGGASLAAAAAAGGSGDGQQPGTASSSNTGGSSGDACLRRSAPAGSLLCRLSLHALVFGNARAVAALWQRFMVQVRLHFWEERTLLPYLPSGHSSSSDAGACGGPPAPDLDSCLLHQKLQMLNVCIWRRDRRIGRRSSSSRQRPPLPPQQLTERSRPSSSGTISGTDSGREPADGLDAAAAAGGSAAGGGAVPRVGRSSSRSSALGLATAASSTFYSVSGDDDDDATAADGDADAALDDGSGWEGGDGGDVSCSAAGDGGDEASCRQQQQQDEGAGDGSGDDEAAEQYADAFSSGSGGAAAASAAPAEWEQQAPRGVAGVVPGQCLLHHPGRPLRVPVVQDEPVFTEDQLIQRQAALMQLAMTVQEDSSSSSSSGAVAGQLLLKQRLLAAPLLSDMGGFKAANPGCCFEDFLRWFSPRDWQHQAAAAAGGAAARSDQADTASSSHASSPAPATDGAGRGGSSTSSHPGGQASARMCQGPANDWRQLWALAEPLPAAAQRPLLNPQKEGEQVLHYLETLSPSGLFSQLLAAAVTESLALLAASRGAVLPAAATVVDRFQAMAAGVLRKGGGFSEALAAAAALGEAAAPPGREQQQQQQHELAGDWQGAEDGLSDVELELLLAEFAYVEQVVVLGESLLHHLPGQQQLAARLLHHLLHGCGSSADTTSNNGSSDGPDAAAAAAAEAADAKFERAVLGTGSRLPAAALSLQEKAALLRWVEAAAAVEDGGGSARPGRQQQQHWGGQPPGSSSEGGVLGGSASYPTLTDLAEAPEGEGERQPQQQQQQQLLAQLRSQQRSLGAPVQQEWVTTCAPITRDSSAPPHPPTGGNSGWRLAPAVAAAVAAAAAAGGPAAAAAAPGRTGGSDGGGGGEGVLVPPSRLYLQEADGEMRVASVLVAQQGA